MQHYEINIYVKETQEISQKIDAFIECTNISRVYHGDLSWAYPLQKLSMLGFTCQNTDKGINIRHLFCAPKDYEELKHFVMEL